MTALDIAKDLVAIPSVTGSEADIAKYLEHLLLDLGCSVSLHQAAENRFNLYARYGGDQGARPGILFHGHLDKIGRAHV